MRPGPCERASAIAQFPRDGGQVRNGMRMIEQSLRVVCTAAFPGPAPLAYTRSSLSRRHAVTQTERLARRDELRAEIAKHESQLAALRAEEASCSTSAITTTRTAGMPRPARA